MSEQSILHQQTGLSTSTIADNNKFATNLRHGVGATEVLSVSLGAISLYQQSGCSRYQKSLFSLMIVNVIVVVVEEKGRGVE